MASHVLVLAILNIARGFSGIAVAALFYYCSDGVRLPRVRQARMEDGDPLAFQIVAVVLLTIAVLRLLQGFASLAEVWRARRNRGRTAGGQLSRWVGIGLSVLDLIDLTAFPLSTACGVYGLLVYRHADTIDFYSGRYFKSTTAVAP